MRLYLIRHGESEANLKRVHNTPETALTETGIKQAEAIAKRLQNYEIDFIYSSTHKRAVQTAEIVAKTVDIPLEFWQDVVEVRTPSVNWGKSSQDKDAARIERLVDEKYLSRTGKHSDEESFEEIRLRAQKVLEHLLSKHKNQNVLCVSHTSFIKMVVLSAIASELLTPELYLKFRRHVRVNNSGITTLEHRTGHGWILASWNDTSHL